MGKRNNLARDNGNGEVIITKWVYSSLRLLVVVITLIATTLGIMWNRDRNVKHTYEVELNAMKVPDMDKRLYAVESEVGSIAIKIDAVSEMQKIQNENIKEILRRLR